MPVTHEMTLLIKAGSTLSSLAARRGDFEDWVKSGLGVDPSTVSVVDVTRGQTLPDVGAHGRIIITGSHSMVSDHLDWSERTADWLVRASGQGIPTLGICYGHQLLAYSRGGDVNDNPRGPEYGTVDITLRTAARTDRLLKALPERILAHTGHMQSVLRMPATAVILAGSARESYHAARFDSTTWGVQFHPEFDADVMRGYLEHFREAFTKNGTDVDALLAGVRETPASASLLRRFMNLAG